MTPSLHPYSPSIFGLTKYPAKSLTAMQQQRRYEAVQRRQQKKDEAETVEAGDMIEDAVEKRSEDGMEIDQPSTSGIVMPADSLEESFKSLEEDYQLRLEELHAAKNSTALKRGFPDETMLKENDRLTAFYTGLPSYTILMSMLGTPQRDFQRAQRTN